MFNGIIYNTGKIKTILKYKKSILISISSNIKIKKNDIGCSICCNGVCLTLVKIKKDLLYFYISNETLKRSNFRFIKIGSLVNLEKSLIYGERVSGHFSQGHVDTTATVKFVKIIDKTWHLKLQIQKSFSKFLNEKASITINGVSLTISKVFKNYFEVNIIPHTLKLTNLKNLKVNDRVNVELDIFGKYMYMYNT